MKCLVFEIHFNVKWHKVENNQTMDALLLRVKYV